MTLNDKVAAALDEFYAVLGTAATYTPAGGSGTAVSAIITYGDADEREGADTLGMTATIRIRVSEVTTVAVGDTVTIDGDIWEVVYADKSADGLEWIATIHKR